MRESNFCCLAIYYGVDILVSEKAGEDCDGGDAILLPSIEKGIEIVSRADEKRAKLPKKYKVIADRRLPISQSKIENRKSKMY